VTLEDLEKMQSSLHGFEMRLLEMFNRTKATIVQQRATAAGRPIPRPPRVSNEPPPPPPEPRAPNWGFYQEPAQPSAPKLEPDVVTPREAQARLARSVRALRTCAMRLHNASRLVAAIADMVEAAAQRAARG
jgi:hypothetical protein